MSAAPSPMARVRRAPVFRQLGTVFVGLLLGLFVADVAIGKIDEARDLRDDALHAPDPELRWTNRPGFENEKTLISSLGLRSPEIPADAPRDEVRILGVGDSRIYGAGDGGPSMGETWSAHLEGLCRSELEGDWRVLNGGVMGYSAVQAALRAERLLASVEPDLVLVFVSAGSQVLLDPTAGKRWLDVDGASLPADLARGVPEPLLPLVSSMHAGLRHSHLYTRWRAQFQGERQDPTLTKWVLTRAPERADVRAALATTFAQLAQLRAATAARGIELRAVLLPQAFQDSESAWRRYLRKYASAGAPAAGTPRDEPNQVLRERLQAAGLELLSLAREVDEIGSDRERFTCDGAHWSAAGHALVARGLLERLTKSGLADELRAARRAAPRE